MLVRMNGAKIAKIFLAVLFISLLIVPVSFARIVSQNAPIYTLNQDDVVDDDLLVAAESVTIAGTVNGDVYAVAERVVVTGTVNGDIYAAGAVVEITGTVSQDVVAAGGTVTVRSASIGDSLVTAGDIISVSEDVTVAGGLIFAGRNVHNSAVVDRGMYGAAGLLDFNGTVGKDVWVTLGALTAGNDAVIAGDLSYSMEKSADLPESLTVNGATTYVDPASYSTGWQGFGNQEFSNRVNLGYQLWSYSAALLIGLLFLYFFGDVGKNIALTMRSKFWSSLGWGIAVLFGTMPVLILIMLTVVGIPLGLLFMGLFFLEIYFAKIFLGVLYGSFISEKVLKSSPPNKFVLFALGLGVYYVIGLVPFVNVAQMIIAIVLSLGAVFIVKRERFFGSTSTGSSLAQVTED